MDLLLTGLHANFKPTMGLVTAPMDGEMGGMTLHKMGLLRHGLIRLYDKNKRKKNLFQPLSFRVIYFLLFLSYV